MESAPVVTVVKVVPIVPDTLSAPAEVRETAPVLLCAAVKATAIHQRDGIALGSD
jgi:hypothetical protein